MSWFTEKKNQHMLRESEGTPPKKKNREIVALGKSS